MKKRTIGFILLLLLTALLCIPASAAKVKINKKTATINVGKTVQLKITGTKSKVKWSTSNKKIATVTQKGKVTGKKAGKATITAKVGKKKYKCTVTVKTPIIKVSKVTLSVLQDVELKVGDTTRLTAMVFPVNATNKKVIWNSGDPKIATVDQNGNIHAVGKGSTYINVTSSENYLKYAYCRVTVKDPDDISEIVLDKELTYMEIGETVQLSATITPANTTGKVKWRSSKADVASVDDNGKVTAYNPGSTVVYCESSDGYPYDYCIVRVKKSGSYVDVNNNNVELSFGNTSKVIVDSSYQTLKLHLSNASIADVSWVNSEEPYNYSGSQYYYTLSITAKNPGTAVLSVYNEDDPSIEGLIKINVTWTQDQKVTAAALAWLAIEKKGNYSSELGHTIDVSKMEHFYIDTDGKLQIAYGYSYYATAVINKEPKSLGIYYLGKDKMTLGITRYVVRRTDKFTVAEEIPFALVVEKKLELQQEGKYVING